MLSKGVSSMDFPNEIEIGNNKFEICVDFYKKRSSSVSLKENKLVFRLSKYLSKSQAQVHFSDLLRNISKKVNSSKIQAKTFEQVLDEGFFNFNNQRYLIYRSRSRSVKLVEDVFYIPTSMKLDNAKKYVIKILIDRYSDRLKSYVNSLNKQTYNYPISDFCLKLVDSKWGHCTADNSIMLNLKLLNARSEILDYVIFHEISHIKHKNHSDSFWREVSRFCPNYKILRKELKNNPPQLFN